MPIKASVSLLVCSFLQNAPSQLIPVVRQLALQYPKSPFNDGPLLIYLTARDKGRGEEALKILQNDPELKKAKVLALDGGLTDIKFHELDISKTESIRDFSSFLRKQHPDGIDFGPQNC